MMKAASEGQKPRKRSLYRGVSAHGNKWKAQINHAGTQYYLGLFEHEEDAARAYDRAARIIHAHNAVVNFPSANEAEKPQEKMRNPSNRLPRDANPALLGVLFRHPRDDGSRRGPISLGHHAQDVELLMNYRAEMQEKINHLQTLLQSPAFPAHYRDSAMDDFVACSIREMDASTRIDELLHLQAQGLVSGRAADWTFAGIPPPRAVTARVSAESTAHSHTRQGIDGGERQIPGAPYLRPHQVSASSTSTEPEHHQRSIMTHTSGRPPTPTDPPSAHPITTTSSDDNEDSYPHAQRNDYKQPFLPKADQRLGDSREKGANTNPTNHD